MKKLFTLFIILFALALTNVSYSQEKTDAMLFGHVLSKETGEHLPYVSIVLKGTNKGTSTDATGHYALSNLPIGKQTIVAYLLGYKAQEKEIVLEANSSSVLFFELEIDALNLDQVVITGTRTEHYVKDVPIRTEVVTSKSIENLNAGNLFEILETVPGVRVESQCQYCNFTMVRIQGLGAEHTQMLINGHPMYSGLAGVYGLQQLSTVNIDQIEIVKAAGSALYGSGAVAGAINIVTKKPSFTPQTILDVQLGKYGTNKLDLSSSLRNEKGNVGLNVYAQINTGKPIDETGEGSTVKEVKQPDGISDRIASKLTNAGFDLYVDKLFVENDEFVVRGKTILETRDGGILNDDYYLNPFTDGTESIKTDRYEAELNYKLPIGNRSKLNFLIGYVNHNRNATNDAFLSDYMDTHDDEVPDLRTLRPYIAIENTLTSTLSFSSKLKNHSLITGIQAFYDKLSESAMYVVVDEDNPYFGEPYKSFAKKSAFEFGAFVQDEWALFKDKLVIVPGVRFDYHNSGEEYTSSEQISIENLFPTTSFKEATFNPRLAIKYDINHRITLRANVGTGFRAPYGFSEDLHLCSGSPRVWKSSELNPERSLSYNFSADYYGKKVNVSLNLFRTDLKDKIGFKDAEDKVSALGYDYQWDNIDDAFVQGIELTISSNPVKNLNIGVDFTLNQGKYKNVREDWVGTEYEEISKYISRFPMTTGGLKLEYTPKTWTFSINSSYQGTMYIDYYNEDIDPVIGDQSKIKKTKPYALLNARIAKDFKGVRLYAGANNIFNYVQDEKHLDDAAFIYAPLYGIMFYGGIRITLKH